MPAINATSTLLAASGLPIGVFDSGFGGISVLRVLTQQFPQEDFLFFGDNRNAPYGVRSINDIQQLTLSSAKALHRLGIKALVIACNTATGVALDTLKQSLPIPVVGIRPALEWAQTIRKQGQLLVMATPATLSSPAYEEMARRHGERTIHLPCPGLMEFVERGELSGPDLHSFLARLLSPYAHTAIDAVVLGCTHYPLLKDAIASFFPDAPLLDGSGETALALHEELAAHDLGTVSNTPGTVTFLSSAGFDVAKRMRTLYQEALPQA